MPVYAIAQLTINDRTVYDRYVSRFMPVFNRFRGSVLAADESPAVVEGKWAYQKVVLMSFPDEAAFREWAAHLTIRKSQRTATPRPMPSCYW